MINKVIEAVSAALAFHKRRDEMNAALHMQPVRYSPLTLALKDALTILEEE